MLLQVMVGAIFCALIGGIIAMGRVRAEELRARELRVLARRTRPFRRDAVQISAAMGQRRDRAA